jgi:spore coat protein U-like protein
MATRFHRLLGLAFCTLFSAQSWAGSSTTVLVHIQVLGGCTFTNWGDITMNFGSLDSGDKTITTTTPITCSPGNSFHIRFNDGRYPSGTQRQMGQKNGSGRLPYTLEANPSSGVGNGPNVNIELKASVKQSDFQSSPTGQYTDTVIMTVEP